jgi:uncharacterized LabA/DUF88 family protein
MTVNRETARLAVLIDADNTAPRIADLLLAEIAKYGVASVKRAYGDWTRPNLNGWKDSLNRQAIRPIQQFAYTTGKNATDSAMIIDAMDLLYAGRFDGFCLVTSDSDFTGLAARLREAGVTVYGFGERRTPQALVSACDRFIYLDVLREPEGATTDPDIVETAPVKRMGAKELRGDAKLMNLVRAGIDAASDDSGWANLGAVGSHIANQASDFDPRNWGYAKLVDLINAIGMFDVERQANGVRLRATQPKKQPAKQTSGRRAKPPADEPAAKEPPTDEPVKRQPAKRTTRKSPARRVSPSPD